MRAYERFLKYVAFPTMSDPESESVPSTKKQLALAEALAAELREMGLVGVEISEYGYVYASLPANCDKELPTIGFISHMDTSSEAADEPIRSRIVKYTGGDILLNEEKGIYMRTSDYPYLADYAGDELIVTDGTTLLGADDKAGIAEIMTALEKLISENIPHGEIKIAFTPDEEIGRGADHFDVARFGADYAYTVDGGALGELEYENFKTLSNVNYSANIAMNGQSQHYVYDADEDKEEDTNTEPSTEGETDRTEGGAIGNDPAATPETPPAENNNGNNTSGGNETGGEAVPENPAPPAPEDGSVEAIDVVDEAG